MKKADDKVDFNQMVTEIEEKRILLPDFQRKFTWTSREIQKKLAASVLCRMPIGSILLLEMPAYVFAARLIGSNAEVILESEDKKDFLLDGQQRVTVMVNVFSSLIHEGGGTGIESLKRRFFLGIAKPANEVFYQRDFWGLNRLKFPLETPGVDIPDFMTDEIADTIVVKDFCRKDKVPYNPYLDSSEGLRSYCLGQEDYYLIPLYLLVRRKERSLKEKNKRLLQRILEDIAEEQRLYLTERFEKLQFCEKNAWLRDFCCLTDQGLGDLAGRYDSAGRKGRRGIYGAAGRRQNDPDGRTTAGRDGRQEPSADEKLQGRPATQEQDSFAACEQGNPAAQEQVRLAACRQGNPAACEQAILSAHGIAGQGNRTGVPVAAGRSSSLKGKELPGAADTGIPMADGPSSGGGNCGKEDEQAFVLFEEELESRKRSWQLDIERYLDGCMEKLALHVMAAPNSSRAKAIEVFENLNRGGVQLRTFDLVMARAARSNQHFASDLKKECARERTYPAHCIGDRLESAFRDMVNRRKSCGEHYRALIDLGCVDETGNGFAGIFQDAFLNVLSMCCHDGAKSAGRNFREEMRRDSILRLEAEDINGNYRKVCTALDHAAFFLQARCGIRGIREVNNHLMYTVLAYLFLKEDVFRDKKVWKLLTAWYWCAVFAGRYDKDQNVQAARDIEYLSGMIRGGRSMEYMESLQEDVLNLPNFSQKEFLLYQKSGETGIYPKESLGNYFCQFYLSQGYPDVFTPKVFLCTFAEPDLLKNIQKHHIIPLLSMQSIRESEKSLRTGRFSRSILNSPLNFVYVTRESNLAIGARDVASYISYLRCEALYTLDLPGIGESLDNLDIAAVLGGRFDKIRAKLNSCVNMWLMEWREADRTRDAAASARL